MILDQRGLYYEEFTEGVIYRHRPHRTVTEMDNVLFTTLTMNPATVHLDAEAALETEFGRPLVNSLLTLSTVVGLSVGQLTQCTTVANLGFDEVTFPAPVFVGDTLRAETVVADLRLSRSRPDAGVVRFVHTGRNQHGATVVVAQRNALMLRLPGGQR